MSKLAVDNLSSGNFFESGVDPESDEVRNDILPSPEIMREELLRLLDYNQQYPDTDYTALEIGQTNSQEAVKSNIVKAVLAGDYPTAQAILFRESIIMTPQLEEVALRLNRLNQVAVRDGTTDTMEFSGAKLSLKNNENKLVEFYDFGDKQEAQLLIKNVSESLAGTREMDEASLEETRLMVQMALRDQFKSNYETALPPHQLEGQEQGANFINRSQNPKLQELLRLFDALTIEIKKQREISTNRDKKLTLEREITLNILSDLPNIPGVNFGEEMRKQFMIKIARMDLNQLMYLDHKIRALELGVEAKKIETDEANKEIQGWLQKDFTPQELHAEIEEMKSRDETERENSLQVLRGKIKNQPIKMPIRNKPVSAEEYYEEAA